jgi:hypothetical protein
MTPPQAKYTNWMQSMYGVFGAFYESVQHTVHEGWNNVWSMRLTGVVGNTVAEAFLQKAIELEVYAKEKEDDWAEWAQRMYGRTDICGDITIAANVERADDSPIRISVGVTLDLWRDFQRIARSAIDAGFLVQANCGFWSPGEKSHGLDKLDISHESTYPLHSFGMGRSPHRLPSSS